MKQNQIELQGERIKSTITFETSHISQSTIDRTSRQKVSKNIVEQNSTINQLDLIDIYRTLHPTTAECIYFSSSHGTFIKTDHIPDHKTQLKFFKREIIKNMLSAHKGIELEISNRKITGKSQNI